MDKLEFKIKNRVDIFINGKNLIDLLREYELPFAKKEGHPELAGGYGAMMPKDFLHWFSANWPGGNEHAIYQCPECGEVGCWPMFVTVTEENNKVKWSNFNQPHRGPESKASFWDFSNFPSFEFSAENYKKEFDKLNKSASDQ